MPKRKGCLLYTSGVFENGKDKITINVEENTKPSVSHPTKDGYIFQGWDKEITNATEDTTYKAIWKELTLDDLEERNGLFYIDSLTEKDGKLKLKGYNTIEGINNTLDTDIDYTLVFEDVNTKKEVLSQSAKRITDSKEHPFPIYSVDGKDYTYAWFEMDIDISKLPDGNYTMYMVANTDQYLSLIHISIVWGYSISHKYPPLFSRILYDIYILNR